MMTINTNSLLSELAKFERQEPENIALREKLLARTRKHVFLVLGEPRTGKTTLALYAGVAPSAHAIDTDAYENEELFDRLEIDVLEALGNDEVKLILVVVGKHRSLNDQVRSKLQSLLPKDVMFSECLVTRHTEFL